MQLLRPISLESRHFWQYVDVGVNVVDIPGFGLTQDEQFAVILLQALGDADWRVRKEAALAGRRLLDKGVDCLITDRPDLLVPALDG